MLYGSAGLRLEGALVDDPVDGPPSPVIEPTPLIEIFYRGSQMMKHQLDALIRGFTITMDDAFTGIIDRSVIFIDPPAQVGIFQVQEILLVEKPDIIEHSCPDEHETAGKIGDLHDRIVVLMS